MRVVQKQAAAQELLTQLVQLVQLDPLQHIALHWAGGVLPTTQRWKQPMPETQGPLWRQISVWLQHAPMMH